MADNIKVAEYQEAYREVMTREERKGFAIHRLVYICVNAVLIAVNLIFAREFMWFVFPLVGWGIGLTMHYVFGVRKLEQSLREKERRAELEAERRRRPRHP
jgi:hypothetical protein